MSKPRKTVADYMVIALSPVLIMALVGSLCFFLIEVFYRGQMIAGVCWVMFWFIIGIVLVSRIAIEKSTEHAIGYGLGLAAATLLYMHRTQSSSLLGMILLAVVWFCAHKLVWDCTLIDDEQDSSGRGLLHKADVPEPKPVRKGSAPHPPGRWVVYFSLAALPLFGVGQMLLPGDAAAARRAGFGLLALYLAAALGLLVTTSFLGLRRYLRQRYLTMPGAIAVAWLKFGAGVACLVLIGAVFLPRPGANAAWATLRYQIDYQLRRASDYAAGANPPGQGQGRAGNQTGGKQGSAQQTDQTQGSKQTPNQEKPGETQQLPQPKSAPALSSPQAGNIYSFLRIALLIAAALVIGAWIVRRRHLLLEMARSILAALAQFIRNLFDLMPSRKPASNAEAAPVTARFNSFAEYTNPFFTAKDRAWPPEQIILYSYEAVQAWAKELGIASRPEETAREFCGRLGEQRPELDLDTLARLYSHAAYGKKLPPQCDLEPIRELWRRL
ncbi:MAG: DUF4129 domain-containing protein [Verrucomicrobiota bacterium]|jgi:hypothetical protein